MKNFIAHRGNDSHSYNENTMEAILESLKKDYIAGVEFDVRMTKDKKIVLIHNSTISQASDGWGFVKHMTLKQLRKYNFGTKENPARVATLDQVLKKIKTNKKIVIDIKEETQKIKVIVDKIYKIVNKNKSLNLYICSFNHKLVEYYKKKHDDSKTGVIFLFSPDIDKTKAYTDFYVINHKHFNNVNTKKEVMLWTVNTKEVYKKIQDKLSKNVDVITDKAYLLKDIKG
jgi:glycerophosphoryl diester phosphodiesterase